MSAFSSGLIAAAGGKLMFCGSRRSRTLLSANEPPKIAAAPNATSASATTAPAQLIIRSTKLLSLGVTVTPSFLALDARYLFVASIVCATLSSLVVVALSLNSGCWNGAGVPRAGRPLLGGPVGVPVRDPQEVIFQLPADAVTA